jgi:hypothetical protein
MASCGSRCLDLISGTLPTSGHLSGSAAKNKVRLVRGVEDYHFVGAYAAGGGEACEL